MENLHELIKDDEKLLNYSEAGLIRAEDFRLEIIMGEWKSLIQSSFELGYKESEC